MPCTALNNNEWQKCVDTLQGASGVEYIVASKSLQEGVPEDFLGF